MLEEPKWLLAPSNGSLRSVENTGNTNVGVRGEDEGRNKRWDIQLYIYVFMLYEQILLTLS